MNKLLNNDRLFGILIPIIAVILGLLLGGVVMMIGGYDPIAGYEALYNGIFGSSRAFGEAIRAMTPLLLAGLSVAFAFRTGLFNIGVEGQFLVGWFCAVAVGVLFDLPMYIHLPLAIVAAAFGGMMWGFVPGLLKARFQVNEVIVTIMMNYIALFVTGALIREFIYGENEKSLSVADSASLKSDWLMELTMNSRLHWGILIALLFALIIWYLLEKTTLGYELKAVGHSLHAAKYAGMSVNRNVIVSMMIAGSLAGLAGAMEGLGTYGHMGVLSSFTGTGFDGIAVALLGANSPLGIVFASFLFGGLQSAAPSLQFNANVPSELINIINAFIILFVACSYVIRMAINRIRKGGAK
ncbi:MAG: ABC transporter permease [Bacilli bacterium]